MIDKCAVNIHMNLYDVLQLQQNIHYSKVESMGGYLIIVN